MFRGDVRTAGFSFCVISGAGSVFTFERFTMLRWALIFFIVAIVAGLLGFGGIAGDASAIARILFFVFLVVFLVSLIVGLITGKKMPL